MMVVAACLPPRRVGLGDMWVAKRRNNVTLYLVVLFIGPCLSNGTVLPYRYYLLDRACPTVLYYRLSLIHI